MHGWIIWRDIGFAKILTEMYFYRQTQAPKLTKFHIFPKINISSSRKWRTKFDGDVSPLFVKSKRYFERFKFFGLTTCWRRCWSDEREKRDATCVPAKIICVYIETSQRNDWVLFRAFQWEESFELASLTQLGKFENSNRLLFVCLFANRRSEKTFLFKKMHEMNISK